MNICALCSAFGFTRQAYYKLCKNRSKEDQKNQQVLQLVRHIRKRQPRLSSIKLHSKLSEDMQRKEIRIGRDKFHRLLFEQGM